MNEARRGVGIGVTRRIGDLKDHAVDSLNLVVSLPNSVPQSEGHGRGEEPAEDGLEPARAAELHDERPHGRAAEALEPSRPL